MQERLRVGVLLESLALRAWEWAMLKKIAGSSCANLALVVIGPVWRRKDGSEMDIGPESDGRLATALRWPLLATYRALERKVECESDAFALQDCSELLAGIPMIAAGAISRDNGGRYRADILHEIERFGIDVFIHLGPNEAAGGISPSAKYGVWSLRHADGGGTAFTPAGFWPVYLGWPVTESRVQAIGPEPGSCKILARSFSGINRISVKLNRSELYWKTLSLLPRKLEELHRIGDESFFSGVSASSDGFCTLGRPTPAHLAGHVVKNVKRRLANRLSRTFTLQQWILLFHLGDDLCTSPSQFQKIIPPADRYWADPHVICREGRYYVFFEEVFFSTEKGRIAVLEIDCEGKHRSPLTVLERQYHLSYPFVFEYEGNVFMIPESAANRTTDLYRCTDFPGKWEFVSNVLIDTYAVDPTILRHQGRWWLFANVVENKGASSCEELFLFHSESLDGPWVPHPKNPIVSDVRKSRPAGAILQRNGKLYRPAQDCSVRYGHSIRIHEINRLTEEDYAETEVSALAPDWDKAIVATHTLSFVPGLTVMDALQPRMKMASIR